MRHLARLAGALLLMLPYPPVYLLGAWVEAVRAGWRHGRDDVRSLTG